MRTFLTHKNGVGARNALWLGNLVLTFLLLGWARETDFKLLAAYHLVERQLQCALKPPGFTGGAAAQWLQASSRFRILRTCESLVCLRHVACQASWAWLLCWAGSSGIGVAGVSVGVANQYERRVHRRGLDLLRGAWCMARGSGASAVL